MRSSHTDRVDYETYETTEDQEKCQDGLGEDKSTLKRGTGKWLVWGWRTLTSVLLLVCLVILICQLSKQDQHQRALEEVLQSLNNSTSTGSITRTEPAGCQGLITYHAFSSDCEASRNQGDYNCMEATDGIREGTGNGWAYNGYVPSWAVFKFTEGHEIDRVEILNGVGRPDHKLVSFKVELRTEQMSDWQKIEGLIVKDDSSAQVDAAGGKITLSTAREELILNFPAVKGVTEIKLTVYETNASNNNAVVTEIRVPSIPIRG